MQITLTNRAIWAEKVEKAILNIKAYQAREDRKYEDEHRASYRKFWGFFGYKNIPDDQIPEIKPTLDDMLDYPCMRYYSDLYDLRNIERALVAPDSSTIVLTGGELRTIDVWQKLD